MLYCPNFFWNVLQVWMTGKDVYLQMTWSWPDKTWNILCSYCLQWNTSQSKFRNHYFLFLFAFSILSQLFLIWGCSFSPQILLSNMITLKINWMNVKLVNNITNDMMIRVMTDSSYFNAFSARGLLYVLAWLNTCPAMGWHWRGLEMWVSLVVTQKWTVE